MRRSQQIVLFPQLDADMQQKVLVPTKKKGPLKTNEFLENTRFRRRKL